MSQLHNWFETRVQYEKLCPEDGLDKKVTEVYLVDALSFTEAEARTIELVKPYVRGEFTIVAIKRAKLYEVFTSPICDKWFKVKVQFITLDQEKGTEKRVPAQMMLSAYSLNEARVALIENMKGTMSDYEIVKIEETPILEVSVYEQD